MVPLFKALLWDGAVARAAFIALLPIVGVFFAQPTGRTIEERLLAAVLVGGGVGAATAGSPRSKEAAEDIADLRARLDALAPKP